MIDILNNIATFLFANAQKHTLLANNLRSGYGYRGFSRWHEIEALDDFKAYQTIGKITIDELKETIKLKSEFLQDIYEETPISEDNFKNHFIKWSQSEKMFLESLNQGIELSRKNSILIYKCLIDMTEEVQNELFRVRQVYNNLLELNFDKTQINLLSQNLHNYFENDYKCKINFNIG